MGIPNSGGDGSGAGGKGARKGASGHRVRNDGRRVGEKKADFHVRMKNEIRGFGARMG